MIYAELNGEKIKAKPGLNALCPICKQEVISKCGSIKIWHWCHKSNKDCDDWYEPESEWHREWKENFPEECQEVTIGKHRADIKINNIIIELQNSSISSEEIIQRENFYENMIWILNGKTLGKGISYRKKLKNNLVTFRWKHPPKSWWGSKKKKYIDFEEYLLLIKNYYYKIPCGGYGEIVIKEEFLKGVKNGVVQYN